MGFSRNLTAAVAICAALAGMTASAEAALIGGTVKYFNGNPDTDAPWSTDSFVVGPGSEIVCPDATIQLCGVEANTIGGLDIDFTADSITVRLPGFEDFAWGDGSFFAGFSFEDLDFGADMILTGAELDPASTVDASRLTFGPDFVRVNLADLRWGGESDFYSISLTSGPRATAVAVPPALALFVLGLALAGRRFFRRD